MKSLNLILCIITVTAHDYQRFSEVKKCFKIHREVQIWANALEVCRHENATLAMPADANEMKILNDLFNNLYPVSSLSDVTHKDDLQLGFHDIFEEGEYITTNGKSIQYYFHMWGSQQPNGGKNQNCGSMLRGGVINDYFCNVPALFVCEKEDSLQDNSGLDVCGTPDPAYKLGIGLNYCYKVHMNPRKWDIARAICEAEGGHLAVIKNKKEEKHLADIFTDSKNRVRYVKYPDLALIGFHDQFKEGQYLTVEGENLANFEYVNWGGAGPDNSGGNENCGSMGVNGELNDFSCDVPAVFICQRLANLNNIRYCGDLKDIPKNPDNKN